MDSNQHPDAATPIKKTEHDGVTRRHFLEEGARALGGAALLSGVSRPAEAAQARSGAEAGAATGASGRTQQPSSFLDLLRVPDAVIAYSSFAKTFPVGPIRLERSNQQWHGSNVTVESIVRQDELVLTLQAPAAEVAVVHVRWRATVTPALRVLGDAWERSYGDLGWRDLIPERAMPWYCATYDGAACHVYGVKTDARALCFWQIDAEGVSLWLNVANGGRGVQLGPRQLTMASVVSHRGVDGETAVTAVRELCRTMRARPSRPMQPIYGANDWCYSYGKSTAASILRDTEFIAGLSPDGGARPFSVIDEGWKDGSSAWPDMGKLAQQIKQSKARPGLWIRPLAAAVDTEPGLLLNDARFGEKNGGTTPAYDPTIPEAQQLIRAKVRQVVQWGYEMVKHDFSTYDLLGQWGFAMGPQPTLPGWSLHDRTLTNAEAIAGLYALIRDAAGPQALLDGCNTVGHLGQGFFDLQRTGDDTSGHQWERTRRMGVNTLAFRLPQHGTFFTLDADLVGMTDAVPWEFNRQWLDVLARSGTATLVSVSATQRGPQQQAALRDAFAIAAAGGATAEPIDWIETSAPERWRSASSSPIHAEWRYRWSGSDGASPFLSP